MRVLYLHQHFTTPQGSAGIRSYQFAKKLIEHGHTVTVLCGSHKVGNSGLTCPFKKGWRKGVVEGINVVEFDLKYSNTLNFYQRVIVFIRYIFLCIVHGYKVPFDIVFATSTPLTVSIPAIILKLFKHKTFIFEVRDLWPELPVALAVIKNPVIIFGLKALEWASYNFANGCIGLSPGILDGIKKMRISKNNLIMIPNGCDSDIFKPVQKNNPDRKIRAIFSGAHGLANGIDAILDMGKILVNHKRNDIEIVLIGRGKYKEKLKKRAKDESITTCTFLDPVPKMEIAKMTASCDIGLMVLANIEAFYYGTSPNKFFDYIASGIPVVNNYPGWIADMINEYHCGIVVPPDNPEKFAEAIEWLADNPDDRKKMGDNAFVLSKKFDRTELAEKFVGFLENWNKNIEDPIY